MIAGAMAGVIIAILLIKNHKLKVEMKKILIEKMSNFVEKCNKI